MGMSKNNKQLIGMKILDDGVVEFLVKLKDRNEPEWVNFTDIDSNSLRPMLSALGKFLSYCRYLLYSWEWELSGTIE